MTDKKKPAEGMSLAEIDILTGIYTIEEMVSQIHDQRHAIKRALENIDLNIEESKFVDELKKQLDIVNSEKSHMVEVCRKILTILCTEQFIICGLVGILLWKIF